MKKEVKWASKCDVEANMEEAENGTNMALVLPYQDMVFFVQSV